MEGKGLLVKIAKDAAPDIDAVCHGVAGRNACPLVRTKQPKCPPYLDALVDKLETIAGRLRLGVTTLSSDFTQLELAALDGKAEALSRIDKTRDIKSRHDEAVRKSVDAGKQH